LVAQLFERPVWTQKALFQKVIFISLLGRALWGNDITTKEFEKITSYAIGLL